MKLSDFIDAVKEFFLDIIGYFVPGFFGVLILSICIQPNYKFNLSGLGFDSEWNIFIILFLSYLLGYLFYSFSDLTDKLIFWLKFLKLKTPKDIDREIESSQELQIAKTTLKDILVDKNGLPVVDVTSLNTMRARNLRSIVMSYVPEADTKIYTFMFRSELCRVISSVSFLISLFGFVLLFVAVFTKSFSFFKTDPKSIMLYCILFVSSFFLTKTRIRFLSIAYKIPFSIFIAKFYPGK